MNVSRTGGAIPPAYRLPPVSRPQPAASAVEIGTSAPAGPAPGSSDAAPPGSDPALWSILTSEERRFFAQQAALGPINYGPGRAAAPPTGAPLGGRIDVRG